MPGRHRLSRAIYQRVLSEALPLVIDRWLGYHCKMVSRSDTPGGLCWMIRRPVVRCRINQLTDVGGLMSCFGNKDDQRERRSGPWIAVRYSPLHQRYILIKHDTVPGAYVPT